MLNYDVIIDGYGLANMNEHQKQQLKNTLLSQKEAIEDRLQTQAGDDRVELDQSRQGRLSRMDALQQQAMAKATLGRLRNDLHKVKRTLLAIETEDYGYCLECDEPIDFERLSINPTITLCKACMQQS